MITKRKTQFIVIIVRITSLACMTNHCLNFTPEDDDEDNVPLQNLARKEKTELSETSTYKQYIQGRDDQLQGRRTNSDKEQSPQLEEQTRFNQ